MRSWRVVLIVTFVVLLQMGKVLRAAEAPAPEKLQLLTEFFENEVATGKLPGGRGPDPAAWPTGLFEDLWCARRRDRPADDVGYDLRHPFHDQAAHELGCDDAGRRRQLLARKADIRPRAGRSVADVLAQYATEDGHGNTIITDPHNSANMIILDHVRLSELHASDLQLV